MGLIQKKEKELAGIPPLELKRVIDQVSRDKGINKEVLIIDTGRGHAIGGQEKIGFKKGNRGQL